MSHTICRWCGQQNSTGHICLSRPHELTAVSQHPQQEIVTDNTAVIRTLEKRVEELDERNLGLQDTILRLSTEITERGHTIARLTAKNQRLRGALAKEQDETSPYWLRAKTGGGE